jgi:hypothetical protein
VDPADPSTASLAWDAVRPIPAEVLGQSPKLPKVTRGAAFAELLIDCEEDRTLRAVLVGMLREAERR